MKARSAHLSDDSGQVIVFAVLSMTVMLGLLALAADVGMLLHERRVMQTAADSAAIAGAAEIDNAYMVSAADADAAQNGIPSSAVTVNLGPSGGPHAGNAAYVEVLISQAQPTLFMRLFVPSMTVGARAVATNVPDNHCIYTLAGSGADIIITGSGSLSMPSCGILDDSSSANAIDISGGGSVSAKSIGVVGSASTGGGAISPDPPTTIFPVANPLSAIVPPTFVVGSCNAAISYAGGANQTVGGPSAPGGTICYNGFSNIGSGNITFPPGIYVIDGNFNNSGTGAISGTGVTIYVTGGSLTNAGSGALDLSAPTSGPYTGILFYQNPKDNLTMNFTASSSSTLNGIFYVPSAQLTFTGSGGPAYNVALVVQSLSVAGNVNLSNYVPPPGATPPISMQRLVE